MGDEINIRFTGFGQDPTAEDLKLADLLDEATQHKEPSHGEDILHSWRRPRYLLAQLSRAWIR